MICIHPSKPRFHNFGCVKVIFCVSNFHLFMFCHMIFMCVCVWAAPLSFVCHQEASTRKQYSATNIIHQPIVVEEDEKKNAPTALHWNDKFCLFRRFVPTSYPSTHFLAYEHIVCRTMTARRMISMIQTKKKSACINARFTWDDPLFSVLLLLVVSRRFSGFYLQDRQMQRKNYEHRIAKEAKNCSFLLCTVLDGTTACWRGSSETFSIILSRWTGWQQSMWQ